MNNAGKMLTALVTGVAIGAVLGILFAPDKGTETRKKIAERGKKFSEGIKERFHNGKEKFEGLKKDARKTADSFSEMMEEIS